MITGIDVSRHQGSVDWKKVRESGQQFAFVKATEGIGYVDPRFRENWAAAKEAGLIRGAYHFARVSRTPTIEEDAIAEASHFVRTVGDLGAGDLPLCLDIEWDKRAKGIKPEEIVRWCRTFLEHVEDLSGCTPIVYTGRNFWRYKLAKTWVLRYCSLWLVRYTKKTEPRGIPDWPHTFWQWTGKGACPGVVGAVDCNRFGGTLDELRELAHVPRVSATGAEIVAAGPMITDVVTAETVTAAEVAAMINEGDETPRAPHSTLVEGGIAARQLDFQPLEVKGSIFTNLIAWIVESFTGKPRRSDDPVEKLVL